MTDATIREVRRSDLDHLLVLYLELAEDRSGRLRLMRRHLQSVACPSLGSEEEAAAAVRKPGPAQF